MASIMVVDDSSIIRYRLRDILTKIGHNIVTEAETGIIAVRRFKEFMPELVTMDITMPEMDGITALEKILEISPKTKVVMLSAMGQKFTVLQALKSGAAHFIVKPFDEAKVIHVIQEVLGLDNNTKQAGQKVDGQGEINGTLEADNMPLPSADKNVIGNEKSREKAFKIENIGGTFIIDISGSFNNNELQSFKSIIEGLVHVKPLNVVFDFGVLGYLEKSAIEEISQLINRVINAGGGYILSSRNEKFISYVRMMNIANMSSFLESY